MSERNRPKEVEVRNSDGTLMVRWEDGHLSEFPLFGLRKNCPCVECRGGHGSMGRYDRSLFRVKSDRSFEIENIRQIGNHAIRIYWSDGHSNGMYQWETLRSLCPCRECFPESDEEE